MGAGAGRDRQIRVWHDGDSAIEPIAEFEGHTEWIQSASFSPADDRLATGGKEGWICLWHTPHGTNQQPWTLEKTILGHSARVWSVAWSHSGELLASGDAEGVVKLWNPSRSLSDARYDNIDSSHVYDVAFSPDGATLAISTRGGAIDLFDVKTRSLLERHWVHRDRALSVTFTPDGSRIVSRGGDGTTKLWRVATGAVEMQLPGDSEGSNGVAVSRDGRTLATTSNDRTVQLYNLDDHVATISPEHAQNLWWMTFAPDGKILATCTNEVALWDVATGDVRATFPGGSCAAFDPHGRIVATDDGTTVTIWDVASGQLVHTLVGHTQYVEVLTFSPDGKTLASGGRYGSEIMLWDVRTAQLLAELAGDIDEIGALVFSPAGDRLIVVGNEEGSGRVVEWARHPDSWLSQRRDRWDLSSPIRQSRLSRRHGR